MYKKKNATAPYQTAFLMLRKFWNASSMSNAKGIELDIDIHTIEDEQLMNVLNRLCEGLTVTKQLRDENGKLMVAPVKNEKGEITHAVPVVVEEKRFLPWAAALRAATTKLLAARFIDDFEVETYKIRLRNEFDEMLTGMTLEDRAAFSPLIHIIEILCETALDDAKGGRKMLALKVNRKELKVGMVRTKKG